MAPSGAESKPLRDLLDRDLDEEMDYESDTKFVGPNGSPLATITSEDVNNRAPSVFIEHGAADTLTVLRTSPDLASAAEVNTNPLDEQQQQMVAREERAKRRQRLGPLGRTERLCLSGTLG